MSLPLQQNQATPAQRPAETPKNQPKNQMWSRVVGITLVEGQDLPQYGHGDIYVRLRLGDQKYKSKVGRFSKSLFLFPLLRHSPFSPSPQSLLMSALYTSDPSSQPLSLTSPRLPLSRCLSVTHLHLGSLGHGRGSSLDWARLPLTSPCASGAGLHCLHLHTQHALFIYLYLLASPLMILWCTCLVLSCYFFVNLSAFLSACLFVGQS